MKTDAILATLDDYALAYCAKDIDSLMHVFDDSDNISVIGTGADELCVGRDAVKDLFRRNFSEATANKFEWDWVDTRISTNHAVISVTLTIHIEYKKKMLKKMVKRIRKINKHNVYSVSYRTYFIVTFVTYFAE